MGAMARAYLGERSRHRTASPAGPCRRSSGPRSPRGILLKGPLILMFVGLTIVALWRSSTARCAGLLALRPIAGLLWLCVLVLPWFLAIMGRAGTSFFAESVGQDLLSKVFSAQEAHGAPPGYYFAAVLGDVLAGRDAGRAWRCRASGRRGARRARSFLLAWIVPAWIVLELVITKLPHYVLPLYPAIAILIAGVVDPHSAGAPALARRAAPAGGSSCR